MQTAAQPGLKRALGFWTLTIYGVGDILGAGIYALVGKVAGAAGSLGWMSFGVAMLVASLTGLAYAELVSRYPRSGGESYFTQQAFRSSGLALLIGWLVFCSGVVSLSTITRAFADYAKPLFVSDAGPFAGGALWDWTLIPAFLVVLAGINLWGIRQSSAANVVFTAVEASGLLLVIVVGLRFLYGGAAGDVAAAPVRDFAWTDVATGATLAFFAFIGFEDMVNVAEEVESPERVFPAAILTAVGVTGLVYMIVAAISTSIVMPAKLAAADAPLLEVVRRSAPAVPDWLFTPIALFAVANTGLLNYIMASRLVYGMARQDLLPAWLGRVNAVTQTPHLAIVSIFGVAVVLALSGTITLLAKTTSALLLLVFFTVNVALVRIRSREGKPATGFRVPTAIPVFGAAASAALLAFIKPLDLLLAAGIVAVGLVVVAVHWWRTRGR